MNTVIVNKFATGWKQINFKKIIYRTIQHLKMREEKRSIIVRRN